MGLWLTFVDLGTFEQGRTPESSEEDTVEAKTFDLFYCVDGAQAIVLDGSAQEQVWSFVNENLDEVVTFNTGAEGWSDGLTLSELGPDEPPPPWGHVGQYGKFGCILNDAREGWQGDRSVWVTLLPYDESPRGLLAFLRELEASSGIRFGSSFVSASDCDRFADHFVFNPEEDEASLEERGDAIPSEEVFEAVPVWGRDHAARLPAPEDIDPAALGDEDVQRFEAERQVAAPCPKCLCEGVDPRESGICRRCWGTGKDSFDSSEIDLSDEDLRSLILEDAELIGARLIRVNLTGADVTSSTLDGADLSEARLGGANLQGVTLVEAKLVRADLRGANLKETDLDDADLTGANAAQANLSGARLTRAIAVRADLSGADLSSAVLVSANLDGARLDGANLVGADLTGANLANTEPEKAGSLWRAKLVDVSGLTDDQREGCRVAGAILETPPVPVAPPVIEDEDFWRKKIRSEHLGTAIGRSVGYIPPGFWRHQRERRDQHMAALRGRLVGLPSADRIAAVRAHEELEWALNAERTLSNALRRDVSGDELTELAERLMAWLDIRGFTIVPKPDDAAASGPTSPEPQ